LVKDKNGPHRKCVACRNIKKKKELLRLVNCSAGWIFDYKQNMDGRGCYVCPEPTCIKRTKKQLGKVVVESIIDGLNKAVNLEKRKIIFATPELKKIDNIAKMDVGLLGNSIIFKSDLPTDNETYVVNDEFPLKEELLHDLQLLGKLSAKGFLE